MNQCEYCSELGKPRQMTNSNNSEVVYLCDQHYEQHVAQARAGLDSHFNSVEAREGIERLRAELDALKAWKAEIEKQEPVAWVSPDVCEQWIASLKRKRKIWWENIKGVGIPVYTKPVPSKPAQEPVAWMDIDENGTFSGLRYWSEPDNRHEVALYTTPLAPAQRKRRNQMTDIYKFNANGRNAPAYGCNKPGDNSGEYVRLEDLERLRAELDATNEQFNAAINFAIDQGIEAAVFLNAWREGDTAEWLEFDDYLAAHGITKGNEP